MRNGDGQYQLFDRLRDEEYEALKADIQKRGVLIPVEKDEDGHVLDGHHRVEIAEALGIEYPVKVRRFKSEAEKREHVIKINMARRHFRPHEWGAAFAMLLEERGVKRGKGGDRGNQHEAKATVALGTVAKEVGVAERTAKRRLKRAEEFKALPIKQKEAVQNREKPLSVAVREAKREQAKQKSKKVVTPSKGEAWQIVTADFPDIECIGGLGAISGTPRLIFADPPYNIGIDYGNGAKADSLPDDEYLSWVFAWLGVCCDWLAGDGSLWVLIGDEYAAEFVVAMKRLGLTQRNWIKWYETFGVNCSGKFNRCSRHLLYFVKNPKAFVFNEEPISRDSARQVVYNDSRAAPAGKLWDDVWAIPRLVGTSKERVKGFPTQLPLELLRPIILCASEPGDLIADPFCGSGTTGAAAIENGRRFIGIEKNEEFAAMASLRLSQ